MIDTYECGTVITAYGLAMIQPRPNFYQFGHVDLAVKGSDDVTCTHRHATYDTADEYDYSEPDYDDDDVLLLVEDKDTVNKNGIVCSSTMQEFCDTCMFRLFGAKDFEPMDPDIIMSFMEKPSIGWDVTD